jgi:ABC-type thiamin/hydroxymethylpyrimidine transport system permease subunit
MTPPPGTTAAQSFVETLNEVILFPLIALLMGVAFLVFLYGAAEYVRGANNPSAREQGAKHITYGIIGLVVMVSAWAILNLAAGTFGLPVPE